MDSSDDDFMRFVKKISASYRSVKNSRVSVT